jgi:hypothetical protein
MAKGSAFERLICRRLTRWLDPAAEDVLFWRTAGSGGRATTRTKTAKHTTAAHCGDIAAIDDRGAFLTKMITFELKAGYPRAQLHHLIAPSNRGGRCVYDEWIGQATKSAAAAGSPFWAILHHQRGREVVMTGPDLLFNSLIPISVRMLPPVGDLLVEDHWTAEVEPGERHYLLVTTVLFENFLAAVPPVRARDVAAKMESKKIRP